MGLIVPIGIHHNFGAGELFEHRVDVIESRYPWITNHDDLQSLTGQVA